MSHVKREKWVCENAEGNRDTSECLNHINLEKKRRPIKKGTRVPLPDTSQRLYQLPLTYTHVSQHLSLIQLFFCKNKTLSSENPTLLLHFHTSQLLSAIKYFLSLYRNTSFHCKHICSGRTNHL